MKIHLFLNFSLEVLVNPYSHVYFHLIISLKAAIGIMIKTFLTMQCHD